MLRKLLAKFRKQTAREVDATIVSFPKCGRTWLRLLVGRAAQHQLGLIENPEATKLLLKPHELCAKYRRFPYVIAKHEDSPQWKRPEELVESKPEYAGKRVIFLVRDPRDVVVSAYYEATKRLDLYLPYVRERGESDLQDRFQTYEATLEQFIDEPMGSFETILRYYQIWLAQRERVGGFLLVRYEDLHAHPSVELKRVMSFIGLPADDPEALEESVAFCRFDRMRGYEKENRFQTISLRPGNSDDPESYKTREGRVGGFREKLSPELIERMDQRIRDVLDPSLCYPS